MDRKILLPTLIILLLILSVHAGYSQDNVPADFSALYEIAQEGFYRLDPLPESGVIHSQDLKDGFLALIVQATDADEARSLVLYDLFSGQKATVRKLESGAGWLSVTLLDGGEVCVLDPYTLEAHLYDSTLQLLAHFSGQEGYLRPVVAEDGEMLFAVSSDGSRITGFPLKGGRSFVHEKPIRGSWSISWILGVEEDRLFYIMEEPSGKSVLNALSLKEGRLEAHAIPEGFYLLDDFIFQSFTSENERWFYNPLKGSALAHFEAWTDREIPIAARDPLIVSWREEEDTATLQLCSLDSGQVVSSVSAFSRGIDIYPEAVLLSEHGFAVVCAGEWTNDSVSFYLWDFRGTAAGPDAGLVHSSLDRVHAENASIAGRIESRWGIRVYYGVSGNDFQDATYIASPAEDPLMVNAALKGAEAFFAAFPSGMLRELCVPPVTHVGLYLGGRIQPVSHEGIQSPGGFSSVVGDERVVVVNLFEWGKLTQNLAHEFMHAMEDRLWQWGYLPETGGNRMKEWEFFAPDSLADAGYAFSYHNADGSEYADTAYTADDPLAGDSPERVLYIDAYSRTYPLEDRARIFEHLFVSEESPPDFLKYPSLLKKAQYLCVLIREAFDTTMDEGPLRWERHLVPLPLKEVAPAGSEAWSETGVGQGPVRSARLFSLAGKR